MSFENYYPNENEACHTKAISENEIPARPELFEIINH
jgi:hypothetical protein